MPYANRGEAGERLANDGEMRRLIDADTIALGLTRGGVAVAAALARAAGLPLDVIIVRKIGAPGSPEYAIGAIAEDGEPVLNAAEVRALGVTPAELAEVVESKRREIARQRGLYRGGRPLADVRGKTVLLVDDGIATGLTMRAAISRVRSGDARRIVVAVPVGPSATIERLESEGVTVVCPDRPATFWAVGMHYADFSPVEDDEVVDLLRGAGGAENASRAA